MSTATITAMQRQIRYVLRTAQRRVRESFHRRGLSHADAYVVAFPKSGSTWVRGMLETLGLDVHQNHYAYSPHLLPAVYVLRDGRDVVVSLYFHHLRVIRTGGVRSGHIGAFLRDTLGANYDLEKVAANLPAFIRRLDDRPFGGILRRLGSRRYKSWPEHVRDWIQRPGVLVLRYEDLLADTRSEMGKAVAHVGLGAEAHALDAAVEAHAFAKVTGRTRGSEDPTAFARKGIAGDWRNYFTPEAAEAFDAFAGDVLVELGYETDRDWVRDVGSRHI